jgi:hypothetical protein
VAARVLHDSYDIRLIKAAPTIVPQTATDATLIETAIAGNWTAKLEYLLRRLAECELFRRAAARDQCKDRRAHQQQHCSGRSQLPVCIRRSLANECDGFVLSLPGLVDSLGSGSAVRGRFRSSCAYA